MAVLLANNAVSTLASSIGTGATTIAVASGHGSRFPSPSGDDWFPLTMVKNTGELEIVRCTARSADVLTIIRAQEGTPALAFDAGDIVQLRLTSAAFAECTQNADFSDYMRSLIDNPDAASVRGDLGLGNAATRNLQDALFNATAGRVLQVGSFGLGSLGVATANLNTLNVNGFYYSGPSTVGIPIAGDYATVLHQQSDVSNAAAQIYVSVILNRMLFRRMNSGVWSPWLEFYTTANLNPNSYQPALGFTPVQQGGGAHQGTNKVYLGWDGTGLRAQVDGTDLGRFITGHNAQAEFAANIAALPTAGVGTYGFMVIGIGGGPYGPGTVVAGASIGWSNGAGLFYGATAGTWKLLGAVQDADLNSSNSVTLCVRIA
ncbi:hypothetical protein D3C76_48070 [compost metagenome]